MNQSIHLYKQVFHLIERYQEQHFSLSSEEKAILHQWANASADDFFYSMSKGRILSELKGETPNLFQTAPQPALLFNVNIQRLTPEEMHQSDFQIAYSFATCPFGELLLASTAKGLCYMVFIDDKEEGLAALKEEFPSAKTIEQTTSFHTQAMACFNPQRISEESIHLHIKGTDFQVAVWKELVKIPFGKLSSYQTIANALHKPSAARPVGTAIGNNPVTYIIPCHRVFQSGGGIGGYMWGTTRKLAMIGWEFIS
ncbi:MAG: methylated-DNA--[protein]-cysteine S-methyltransferase [Brumimicrobium sp.]|nr:methylated-DNA--[protein]-cysteine S-methyltransferase [Brumimicrobium sp.]